MHVPLLPLEASPGGMTDASGIFRRETKLLKSMDLLLFGPFFFKENELHYKTVLV